MERLGMDNEYEDGHWIDNEFYGNRKHKRSQTKDEILYGVFASGDSDSDQGLGSKKKQRKGISKKTDYSNSVNFVSFGSVIPTQEIEVDGNSEKVSKIRDENDLRPSAVVSKNANRVEKDSVDVDLLPTALGKRILEGSEMKRKEKLMQSKKSLQAIKRELNPNMSGVPEFEKYSKGIGMKMMGLMGYKGGGLGKYEQGIINPLDVTLRPKNLGLGFRSHKEAVRPALQEPNEKLPPLSNHSLEGQPKEKLWSKQYAKKNRVYKTTEELLAEKQEQGFEVIQKVLDMRGPQVRVLTNLENLHAEENSWENDVPMPELQHNMRLIVDLAELDIQKLDKDLRNVRETAVALQKEKENLQKEATQQTQNLENMEVIVNVLDQINELSSSGTLELESLAKSFMDLQTRFADDYSLCNLSCIACSYALPLFIRVFQGWDPLQNPTHGVEVVSIWKKLLGGKDSSSFSGTASAYTQLLMEVVLPAVRISGTNSWHARDPEPMLRLLESWKELLPPVILQMILDSIIMPKISAAVDSWEPRSEAIHIHSWIHPWLPLLGQRLENCFHTIRHRLSSVLHAWHPSDMFAYNILSPWKNVFDPASWEQLMVRYIIPKLSTAVDESAINPPNQNLDQFYWVRTWATVIPTHRLMQLMDVFFNKWEKVLYHWLCSNPNFDEVAKWYLGWKELLLPELLSNEHVRCRLNVGLEMMDEAVEGLEVVPPWLKEKISYPRVQEHRQFETQKKEAALQAQHNSGVQGEGLSGGHETFSLKDVMELHSSYKGLDFKLKPGRMQDGHQIYGFGNVSIILDSLNRKVFALTEERWSLVTFENLLDLHNRSRLKKH